MKSVNKKMILLVEDQCLISMAEKMALEEHGYDVLTARSGEDAIELVKVNDDLDLILMDINLGSGMDGTITAETILAIKDIPIVFLSSHTETVIVEKAERIASYGYVVKDSGIAVLDTSIKMAFKLFDANEKTKSINSKLEATLDVFPPDISKRKNMEEALTISEKRYRRLFETAKDGILILDAETGKIVDANPFLVEMLGYSKEQFIEKAIWEIGVFKDIVANKENFSELQQKEYVRYEDLPLETADGATVEVEFISNVYLVENQKVIQCNIRNITDRKIAEELIHTLLAEKELILREVHHRIKNNMATISGILSLQAETIAVPAAKTALEDAVSRIQSMMVLYTKLYQSSGFKALSLLNYLPALIDEIMANFPNGESVRVAKIIDDFSLDARILQPLGIIINELLTNIMKYAFAGRAVGMITVSALSRGDRAIICVEDDGNGMPAPIDFAHSPGFGLMLVNMLTRQIKGTIRIERERGTKIVLEFERGMEAEPG
jgi:PAS domain S-box-containing protein